MALIDVSELLTDPDFVDVVPLIRRTSVVLANGRAAVTESMSTIVASIQTPQSEESKLLPDGVSLTDSVSIYCKDRLSPAHEGRLADLVLWKGRRFQIHALVQDFLHFGGGGYCQALAIAEEVA